MKRIIIALISLALSVSIYAQEITGKWNQTHQGSENGSEMMTSETLSFMKNSTFEDVVIRVSPDFAPYAHLDYDEANACGFQKGDLGRILP